MCLFVAVEVHSYVDCVTQVEAILDKDNFTLEELLDEEEVIQECKALNSRLINLYVSVNLSPFNIFILQTSNLSFMHTHTHVYICMYVCIYPSYLDNV